MIWNQKIALIAGLVFVGIFVATLIGSSILLSDTPTEVTVDPKPSTQVENDTLEEKTIRPQLTKNPGWYSSDPKDQNVQPSGTHGDMGVWSEWGEWVNATMTEEAVWEIVLDLPEVNEFMIEYPDAESYLYYDGFGQYWYADFYIFNKTDDLHEPKDDYFGFENFDYMTVVVDDLTGKVVEIYTLVEPTLTLEEVLVIASETEEAQSFVVEYPDAEICVFWDYYQYWYVDYYTPFDLNSSNWTTDPDEFLWDYLSIVINDTTGEVIEIFQPIDATRTEEEILVIAQAVPEIEALADEVPDLTGYAYYDFYGTWTVSFSSMEQWEIWAWVLIEDESGDVLDVYIPPIPESTLDEIIDVALTNDEFDAFVDTYPEVIVEAYFFDGLWNVYAFSTVNYDAWAWVLITDDTHEIVSIDINNAVLPEVSEAEAIDIALAVNEVVAFQNDYPNAEIFAYNFDGNWIVSFYYFDDNTCCGVDVEIDGITGEVIDVFEWNYDDPTGNF